MAIIESLIADEIIARLAGKVSSEELSLALAMKAALESPAFTGNPTAPTPATSDNDTTIATTAFVKAALALLVDSSPATLDTLNELAAALGDDPNFATTMTTALGLKAPLASPAFTGNPTAPTPATSDNDTSIATTAFVKAVTAAMSAVVSVVPGTGSGGIDVWANTGWGMLTLSSTSPYVYLGNLAGWEHLNVNSTVLPVRAMTMYRDLGGGAFTGTHEQRVFGVNDESVQLEAVRHRQYFSGAWGAWGAWVNVPTMATSEDTPNTIMARDATGRAEVVVPSSANHVANKGYVDALSFREYGSVASLDGVSNTEQGTLILPDFNILGLPGVSAAIYDEMHVRTTVQWYDTAPYGELVQELTGVIQGDTLTTTWVRSRKYEVSAWGAWTPWAKLAAPAAAAMPYPPITSYASVWWAGPAQSGARPIGVNLDIRPLVIGQPVRLTGFRINVSTAVAATTTSVGLYGTAADGSTPHGGALLATLLSNVDCSTTGVKQATGLAIDLEPGLYWLGYSASGSGVSVSAVTNTTDPLQGMFMQHREGSQGRVGGLTAQLNVAGVLPASLALADTWDTNTAAMWYGLQTAVIP